MTDPTYNHMTLVVDRSGSMQARAKEATTGINQMLADQLTADGKFSYSLVQFDDQIETVVEFDTLGARKFELVPRGSTRLLDAIAHGIKQTGTILASFPEDERPGKVTFVVITDGYENASWQVTAPEVRAMVDHQKNKYAWEFQFIGCDASFLQGAELGFNITCYSSRAGGTQAVYNTLSTSNLAFRAGGQSLQMPDEVE